jgi:hypothetical protein
MVDSFRLAGEGWGNTYPARFALLRLDQIWSSDNLLSIRSFTQQSTGAKRRIVVSDFRLPEVDES